MRFSRQTVRAIMLVSLACVGTQCSQAPPPPPANTGATPAAGAATASPAAQGPLGSTLPGDADFSDNPQTLQALQHDFDVFSWQSFVALNWTALADGSADPQKVIGADGDNRTVWDSYKEPYEVFLPDGSQPPPWGQQELPAQCRNIGPADGKLIQMTQKVSDDVLDVAGQPFGTGPLVDQQNGRYVRYEIRINRDTYDYIVQNTLFNKEGQQAFTKLVQFPSGSSATAQNPKPPVGALVIKAAWKVVDPAQGDVPGRFHKVQAYVYTRASDNPPTQPSCELKTMGLVGFHIAHKTASAPQWVWSTFEQVDNVRVGHDAPPGTKANFHDPSSKYPANTPPPRPWNPNVVLPPDKRSQVTRVIPIDDATNALNAQWQGWLRAVNKDSVWQYYELVSTQWPTQPKNSPTGPKAAGEPAPVFLANATLETYIQGKTPNVSSSCIMCHNNATTTNSKFSDFTYLLERAHKKGGDNR
ncbi:MAG: hypothetical protein LC785_16300 [Acidobacteria bacterium]|nr:hypothetical protein [Acidobacteriota bacterium]MCA1636152.1 hypothetical protein [Acidobacteriota bacterium]MCA1643465.1 hypothetical protein [Acidobacteriota bacterium]